ncbi:hypothetical protein [Duganella fentianensis]|uniref:hypothetical protein n=1 Tax=Duganella fentianensis TaxID=2692177 RepID=UPI0032B130C5
MEARIAKLEEFAADAKQRLVLIETRLDQTATKADVHEMTAAMIKWTVGTAVAIVVAAISVITVVVNTAAQRSPAGVVPTSAPVIIYLPVPVPPASTSAAQPSR